MHIFSIFTCTNSCEFYPCNCKKKRAINLYARLNPVTGLWACLPRLCVTEGEDVPMCFGPSKLYTLCSLIAIRLENFRITCPTKNVCIRHLGKKSKN